MEVRRSGHRSVPCAGGSGRRRQNLVDMVALVSNARLCDVVCGPYGNSSKLREVNRSTPTESSEKETKCRVHTLLALAHPIGWERRGGVIVGGGHGRRRALDIIPCADQPLPGIILWKVIHGDLSRHAAEQE